MNCLPWLPCALLATTSAAQTQLEDLGTLQGREAVAHFVSDDGQVVAGVLHSNAASTVRPFRLTEGNGMEELQLTGTTSHLQFVGMSASGDELVATAWGPPRVLRWNAAGVMEDLGNLGPTATILGAAVSRDGSAVVGSNSVQGLGTKAFRWTDALGMQDLGNFGGDSAQAYDVSGDGSVVVGSAEDVFGVTAAFRWSPASGMTPLSTSGIVSSTATGVSHDGTVIVGIATPVTGQAHVFRFTEAAGLQLLTPAVTPGGSVFLPSVSGDGAAVVWDEATGPNSRSTVHWTAATGPVVLGSLMHHVAVSQDGSVVTGGIELGGVTRPYRWTAPQGMVLLDTLGGLVSRGMALTPDGSSTVGLAQRPGSVDRAVRWETDGEIGARYCGPGVPTTTGFSTDLIAIGSNVMAANACTLRASGLPAFSFGYFLGSRTQDLVFPVPNSDGRLCLGGSIGRYVGPGQVMQATAAGVIELQLPLGSLATPTGPVPALPGDTWNFQIWFRDAGPTSAISNFSNGATLTFW